MEEHPDLVNFEDEKTRKEIVMCLRRHSDVIPDFMEKLARFNFKSESNAKSAIKMILELAALDSDLLDIYEYAFLGAIGGIAAKFPNAAISVYNEWEGFPKRIILSAMGHAGGNNETIISFLQKIASDRGCDSWYRMCAIEALGELKSTQSVSLLRGIVENKEEPKEVRCKAIKALERIDRDAAVPILKKLVSAEDEDMKFDAILALLDAGAREK